MMDGIVSSIRKLTEAGIALVALAIVLEVIFGANVAFVGVGVVDNVISIISTLGGEGLIGLASIAIIYKSPHICGLLLFYGQQIIPTSVEVL